MRKMNVIHAAVKPTVSLAHPPINFTQMERHAANAIKQVEVADVSAYKMLVGILVTAKALARNIFAEFDPWVRKAHAAHKECLAARDKYLGPFEEAEATAKQKLALYCAESGTIPECADVTVSETWSFEIVDASKIPSEFLAPDAGKIKEVVKQMKAEAGRTIPGIRVWSDFRIAVIGDK
jgi:hypothetical protein